MASRDGLYKRGRFWWVRKDPIEGRARTTGCTDYEAAKLWRASRERAAADPHHAAAQAATLGEWIERFVKLKARKKSSSTIAFYEQKLGHWARIFGVDALLAELGTTVSFDFYVETRRGEETTDRTIAKEVGVALSMFRVAKRRGAFRGDLDVLKPEDLDSEYKPRKRALTVAEVVAVLAELEPRRAALVAVCVALGTRLGEAYRLLPSDVSERTVLIRGTKTEGSLREVPRFELFRSLFDAALPYLPLEPWGKLHRDLHRACARAGIDPCGPNDLRRTFATMLISAGVDRDVVRRLMGHTTTLLVDRVYGQPTTEALRELAEKSLSTVAPIQLRDNGSGVGELSACGSRGIRTLDQRIKKPKQAQAHSRAYSDTDELANTEHIEAHRAEPDFWTNTLQDLWESFAAFRGLGEFVYFFEETRTGAVKIGFTGNFETRLISLQGGNPSVIRPLAVLRGNQQLEADCHRIFAHYRIRSEWFRPEGGLAEFIARLAREPGALLKSIRLPPSVPEQIAAAAGCLAVLGVLGVLRG